MTPQPCWLPHSCFPVTDRTARQRAQVAESLFSADAGFALWLAVLAAAESNAEEMEQQIERVGDRLNEETKNVVLQALRSLQTFCDTFNHMDLAEKNDIKMLWDLAMLARAIRKVYGQAGKADPSLVSATSSLPPAYRQAYAPLFKLSPTNVMALLFRSSDYIDRLDAAAKGHPEGTLPWSGEVCYRKPSGTTRQKRRSRQLPMRRQLFPVSIARHRCQQLPQPISPIGNLVRIRPVWSEPSSTYGAAYDRERRPPSNQTSFCTSRTQPGMMGWLKRSLASVRSIRRRCAMATQRSKDRI